MSQLQSLSNDQLALVSGGDGTFEALGRQVGQAGGQAAASATPPLVRPIAQAVLPPAGRDAGGWVGRQVDNVASRLPKLW